MFDKHKKHQFTGLLALSLALILILAACSGQANSSADNPAPDNQTANANPTNEMNSANNTTEEMTENEDTASEEMAENSGNTTADSAGEDTASATVSYAGDVKPILDSRCINCHGGERTEGGLVLLSYDEMMAGGKDGVVIVPGDASGSLLVQLITEGKMPKRGPKVTPVEIEIISNWINEGAQNN